MALPLSTINGGTQPASLAAGDLLVVTDVSDTTEAAAGTTKPAAMSKVLTYVEANISATNIAAGTLAHERGGLEADISAWTASVPKIDGGATSAVAISTFGESLIDDTDASAGRATLGLGSLATVTPTGTPDGTKVLRDDYVWVAQSGSGETILSGAGAPASTPTFEGERYIDTTNDRAYIACGTASSADWKLATEIGSTIDALSSVTPATGDQFVITDASNSGTESKATWDNLVSSMAANASAVNTGTSTASFVTPDALAGSNLGSAVVSLECFGPTTDCATGDGAAYFRVPAAMAGMDIVAVAAACITAGTTGTMDIQIHNVTSAADILSTKITIDSTETDSSTAATAAVISGTEDDLAAADMLRIDVDAVQTTAAKGLIVQITARLP